MTSNFGNKFQKIRSPKEEIVAMAADGRGKATFDLNGGKWLYFFFHHTTCKSTCDTQPSSAANQADNTVSVAQGGTATPGATKQLLPPDLYLKEKIYIYIYSRY